MVTWFACLNPVAILNGHPLILARIKSVVTEELLSFLKCQKAATLTFYISLVIFVVHLVARCFNVPDLLSFEFLIANLIENQLAHLRAASITVICLYPEKELFGRCMWADFPFIPLPSLIPLSSSFLHVVDYLFTFVIINCDKLPLLGVTVFTIICWLYPVVSQQNRFVNVNSDCHRSMTLKVGLAGTILVIAVLVFIQEALNYLAAVHSLISRDWESIIGYSSIRIFVLSLFSLLILLLLLCLLF